MRPQSTTSSSAALPCRPTGAAPTPRTSTSPLLLGNLAFGELVLVIPEDDRAFRARGSACIQAVVVAAAVVVHPGPEARWDSGRNSVRSSCAGFVRRPGTCLRAEPWFHAVLRAACSPTPAIEGLRNTPPARPPDRPNAPDGANPARASWQLRLACGRHARRGAILRSSVVEAVALSVHDGRHESNRNVPVCQQPQLVGSYPSVAKAGGGFVWDAVLEYRVWCQTEQNVG